MIKKKKEEAKDNTLRISPALYWEWRCTIEEVKVSKLNERRVQLERDLMSREIENKKLKLLKYQDQLSSAHRSATVAEAEYEAMRERIEIELGISLNNHAIDPHTFEVKSLE